MDRLDQSRLNNRPKDFLTGREAAHFLDVKLSTIYTYVSRGLLARVQAADGRTSAYRRRDLERLKARHDARAGHGPVAGAALQRGEAVLDSALTCITPEGPRYRGQPALELARQGDPFEAVAEWLWTGAPPGRLKGWKVPAGRFRPCPLAELVPRGTPPLSHLKLVVPFLAAQDATRLQMTEAAELARARQLILMLAAGLCFIEDPGRLRPALDAGTVARAILVAFGVPPSQDAEEAINAALVICADHELNASAFAARVAASAGSDLYACVSAALATTSGPRDGGACDAIEAFLAQIGRPERAQAVLEAHWQRGEAVPGFGSGLYPEGDPRATPLLEWAFRLGGGRPEVQSVARVVEAMAAAYQDPPSLALGLVAVARAVGLPEGAGVSLFAVARSAGWVAHVLEQRRTGLKLRPRARYTGPEGGDGILRSSAEKETCHE
jgi:citrate synthase